jgi:hypothetical protein
MGAPIRAFVCAGEGGALRTSRRGGICRLVYDLRTYVPVAGLSAGLRFRVK